MSLKKTARSGQSKRVIAAHQSILSRVVDQLRQAWERVKQRPQITLPTALFLFSLLVYLLVRLIGLVDFPIYFFTDEAAQTILAQDFLRDGFKNYAGELFPTFFENGSKYNLGFSVYVQIIPLILFGRSVFVTRMVTVFFATLAAIAVGLILRDVFKIKHWWAGVMVLSVTPAWFLHSRTAFETALAVSLYTVFIYFYFLYRFRSRKHLFMALLFGALALYSYSSMQPVVLLTGVLLLLLDGPYHLRGKWITLVGAIELILLGLPYVRFIFAHPYESARQLQMLDSYWVNNGSFFEKLLSFLGEYFKGFNPLFWYGDHADELCRHVMLGYGHLPRILLPFLIVGLVVGILKLINPQYRIMLIILLAAPAGAAVVQLGITRILVMVIPASIYTAIGLSLCMDWVSRIKYSERVISVAAFLALVAGNTWILSDALRNGPLWFHDYTLSGMQYGAMQVFPAAKEYLDENPQKKVIVSPSWGNGTDLVARFILSDPIPIEMGSIDGYFNQYREITEDTTFVMIPDEYQRVVVSDKFINLKLIKTLNYPDETPGFYFVSLEYVPGIEEILAEEQEAWRQLLVGQVMINGIQTDVKYSMLDMGVIAAIFNPGNDSVIRTLQANPMVIELDFSERLLIQQMSFLVGGATTKITLYLESDDGSHYTFEEYASEAPRPRKMVFTLDNPIQTTNLVVKILSVYDSVPGHVHLWEMTIR
jgi:hypothetical protein